MADLEVKQVDVLKAYTNKLSEFKAGCLRVVGAGALIDVQIRNIKDDLKDKANDARNIHDHSHEEAERVISRYETALSHCRKARPIIGDSDRECKHKLQEIDAMCEQINNLMQQLKMELENAGQHTKNFCLQAINMLDGCSSRMQKMIEAAEKYKEQN